MVRKVLMALLVVFGLAYVGYSVMSPVEPVAEATKETTTEETSTKSFSLQSVASDTAMAWLGTGVGKYHHGTAKIASNTIVPTENGVDGEMMFDLSTVSVSDLEGEWAERFNGHLKSPDFFNVSENQYATLEVTNSHRVREDIYHVRADLDFNGVRKPVDFTAHWDGSRFSGDLKFNRLDWNLRYGSASLFDNLGDKAIGDDVHIGFNFAPLGSN